MYKIKADLCARGKVVTVKEFNTKLGECSFDLYVVFYKYLYTSEKV